MANSAADICGGNRFVPSGSNNFLGMTAIGDEENTIIPNVWNCSLHSRRHLNVF
jgi:hypothetical protein